MSSYLVELAGPGAEEPGAIDAAAQNATERFEVLAASFLAFTSKTDDVLTGIAHNNTATAAAVAPPMLAGATVAK